MPSHSSDVDDINSEKISAVWELSERFHVIFLTLEAETEKKTNSQHPSGG